MDVDHYAVLGLPSGEEGARLSEKEIIKAYKSKALEVHPDKSDDPNAKDNFQKLKTSFEILKDEKARKLFDDLQKLKRDKRQRETQQDSKRRKMMSDLEERERAASASDPGMRDGDEEERISRKLQEEIARIRSMLTRKGSAIPPRAKDETTGEAKGNTFGWGSDLDKEKMLKVSWQNIGEGYTAQRLRELFGQFGAVEDVVIKSSKRKGSAMVVMGSKDAAAAAMQEVLGDLSNPLLVLPLQPAKSSVPPVYPNTQINADSDDSKLRNLVGGGHQAFESLVLEKLRKAAQGQKSKNAT